MTKETQDFIIALTTILAPILLAVIALVQVVILRTQREIHVAVNSTATALAAKNATDLALERAKVASLESDVVARREGIVTGLIAGIAEKETPQ